jgi:hypothetical protein
LSLFRNRFILMLGPLDTVEFVEGSEHRPDLLRLASVVDHLRVASRLHQLRFSQYGQVMGNSWVFHANHDSQVSHGRFLSTHDIEDEQARLVPHS